MTKQEAIKRMSELKAQGKKVFDLTFQISCAEFAREEITEIPIEKDDFHYDWQNKIIDYTKSVILDIGICSGIETVNNQIRLIDESCCISTVTVERKMPSLNKEQAAADYEFDAQARFEEEEARAVIKNKGGKSKYNTGNPEVDKAKKQLRYFELKKHRTSRADTGAHKRAIIKLLRLPAAKEAAGAVFFVSKIVPNMDNPDMRRLYLENMSQNAGRIYLPHPQTKTQNLIEEKPKNDTDIVATENDYTELDEIANQGWNRTEEPIQDKLFENEISTLDKISQFLENAKKSGKNEMTIFIVEYVLNNNKLHDKMNDIIDQYNESASKAGRIKAVLKMFMLHEKIVSHKVGDVILIDYLDGMIKSAQPTKLKELIKRCYNIINAKNDKKTID